MAVFRLMKSWKLVGRINQIANMPCPLAEREQQIAELEREIDRLQRTEEAIVVATGAPRQPRMPASGRSGLLLTNSKATRRDCPLV